MKIISLVAAKGGVGKTLLTASLAVLAARDYGAAGCDLGKVAVADLDPQGSLTYWFNKRTPGGIVCPRIDITVIKMQMASLRREGAEYLFIDTPPGHREYIRQAVAVSDFSVLPVKPAELDLVATARSIRFVRQAGCEYAVVPNDATFRSRAMGRAITHLRQAGAPLLPAVHHRVGLMLSGGKTLTETDPTSRGAQELETLWAAIKGKLEA